MKTAADLLLHLPMRYEERRQFVRVAELRAGMRVRRQRRARTSGTSLSRISSRTGRKAAIVSPSVPSGGRVEEGDVGFLHRYGAIGRTGSIALIERFFRTLKALGEFRTRPPLLRADLEARLVPALEFYFWLRPHRGLAGATPAESMLGLRPAHLDAVTPPRGRPGEAVEVSPPFELRYLGPDRSLPYLLRKAA